MPASKPLANPAAASSCLGLGRVVDRRRRLPVEIEPLGDDGVSGDFRVAQGQRLVGALAVDGEAGGLAHPHVVPRRLVVPLVGEIEAERALHHRRLQREAGYRAQLLGQLAAHRIGDVDLAPPKCCKARALVRDHLEDEALDRRLLAPILVERLEHELHPGGERDELVGTGADRRLLETVVADLLDVALGHDPARPGRRCVEGQEIRPWRLQAEADVPGIGRFDRLDTRLQQVVRDAAIALERKLDVGRGHRIAVVEAGAFAQHEIVVSPVLGSGEGLGKARRQRLAGHRFHHRIVQGIEHHERRDDAGRLGRLEPRGRERDMDAPGQPVGRSRAAKRGPLVARPTAAANKTSRRPIAALPPAGYGSRPSGPERISASLQLPVIAGLAATLDQPRPAVAPFGRGRKELCLEEAAPALRKGAFRLG